MDQLIDSEICEYLIADSGYDSLEKYLKVQESFPLYLTEKIENILMNAMHIFTKKEIL